MQGEGQRSRACSTYSNIAPFSNSPINLNDWIEKNKQTLLPPINNRQFWKEDWQNLMVMMVGGPNYRPDYHNDPVFGFPVTIAPNLSNRVDGSDSLLVAGMPASPHQLSVLKTVRHKSDQGLSEGAIGSFDDHHLAVAAKVRGRARLRRLLIAFVIIVFFVGVWLTEVPWT